MEYVLAVIGGILLILGAFHLYDRWAGLRKLREKLEREAEIGRTYVERLRGEVVRLACLVQPEADRDLMERVARRLDWEELDGLKKLYQAQADRRFIPQSQLWQGEDRPEDRRGDSGFLI